MQQNGNTSSDTQLNQNTRDLLKRTSSTLKSKVKSFSTQSRAKPSADGLVPRTKAENLS